ncbi:UNVERIFIED_CONTAM: hypothetical protein HDU68_007950 [Siphonaria sp. JEL0065]|nr:hypothetical protein HDU68_007950 [Siphonaria sp. JEL0065]
MVSLGAFGGNAFTQPGFSVSTTLGVKSAQQCSDMCPGSAACVVAVYSTNTQECDLSTLGATKDGMSINIITSKNCNGTTSVSGSMKSGDQLRTTSSFLDVKPIATLNPLLQTSIPQGDGSDVNLNIGGNRVPKMALIAGGISAGVAIFLGIVVMVVRARRMRKAELVNPVLGKPVVKFDKNLTYEQRMMRWLFERSDSLPMDKNNEQENPRLGDNLFKQMSSKP